MIFRNQHALSGEESPDERLESGKPAFVISMSSSKDLLDTSKGIEVSRASRSGPWFVPLSHKEPKA